MDHVQIFFGAESRPGHNKFRELHLAAKIRGVGYNVEHHGEMFFSNALINLHMLEAARLAGVDRFLSVSSVGVYPKDCAVPTPEEDGFKGEPEASGYGYGWAKRLAEVQSRCYAQEYGMKIAIVRPYNVYGPRMQFDPETAPVISAQIMKVLAAQDVLTIWGDGEQTRSFTYVSDEVDGMMLAVEKHPFADPLNIGTSEEIKIKDLIETRVRPAVANDGGDITFRGFKDGVVYLNMKGSCAGCPSSTATLQHGIQNLLRHFVPDVVEVRPI